MEGGEGRGRLSWRIYPKMLCDQIGGGQKTGRWTITQATEPREPRSRLRALFFCGKAKDKSYDLQDPSLARQMKRWLYKHIHTQVYRHTQTHGHTDQTHRDVHKAVHGDKCTQEQTCTHTHYMHTDTFIYEQTQTHRGACFPASPLPIPTYLLFTFSLSSHSPLPAHREGG